MCHIKLITCCLPHFPRAPGSENEEKKKICPLNGDGDMLRIIYPATLKEREKKSSLTKQFSTPD